MFKRLPKKHFEFESFSDQGIFVKNHYICDTKAMPAH